MKKKLSISCVVVLLLTMCVACSQTLLNEVESIVNTLLPVVETAANIVIATEAPEVAQTAQTVENAVNYGLAQIEQLIGTISTDNATTVRGQIVAIADALKAQLQGLLTAGQVKNPATAAKVTQLVGAADLMIDSIIAAIPAQQNTQLSASQKDAVKIAVTNFKHNCNKVLNQPTGDAKVDAVLSKAPRFRHWYGKQY